MTSTSDPAEGAARPDSDAPDLRGDAASRPETGAPDLHGDAARPGSDPAGAELPGAEVPAPGTSEEFAPVQGVHVPEIGEEGRAVPGRYRTEGPPREDA